MRWSLTIYALIGLSLFCDAVLASNPTATETLLEPRSPETDSPSSSSSSSARTLPVHDVGLPSELAWQAWLVVASKPDSQSSFESATVPRRISPKSVFVAPRLEKNRPCSDGYKADGFGGCETDTIKINPQDHWNFVIERINAMYPKGVGFDDSAATSSELKHSALSGPLQVNISLGIDDNSPPSWSEKSEGEKQGFDDFEDSVEISVLQVPPQKAALTSDMKPATKTEAALTLYKVENGTKKQEEKDTFFRCNSSKPVEDIPVVVPIAELVDDGNQTFAEVIDYEIPLSLKQLFNISHGDLKESESSSKNITKTESADSTRLPTVVLLLSPSTLTTAASTSHTKETNPDQETSIDKILVKTENLTVKSTEKETAPVTIGGPNSPSENIDDKDDDEVTDSDYGFEETTLSETTDVISTTSYPEEDLDQTTEWNDEILAHEEAGLMVSEDNFESSTSTNDSKRPTVLTSDNTFDTKTTEEENSNISSESSIRGDVIVETTLLDLNTGVITGATPTHEEFDDYRELFEAEKEISLEPEVVFSPQDVHRLDRTNTRDTKRAGDSTAKTSIEHRQPISFLTRTVPPVNFDDVSTAHSSPQKTMERYVSRLNEHTIPKENLMKRTYTNQDYVRFPEESRQPPSSGYVLFSSDRSNRINSGNLRYKESSTYGTGSAVPQVVPKTNAPLNQRNTHWRLPPGWRIDDLQPPPQPVALQNVNQRQNPMLLRFWTRMPLFRDPSLTSSSRVLPMVNQRGSIYRQIPAQAVNRDSPETVRGSNPVQQFG